MNNERDSFFLFASSCFVTMIASCWLIRFGRGIERAQDKMRNAVGIQTQKAKGKAEHMGDEPGETAGQGRGKAAEESLGTERPDVKDLSGRTG